MGIWKRIVEILSKQWGKICLFFRTKSARNVDLGKKGEDLAAKILKRKGFKILTRNWTYGRGEIDLVAFDKCHNILVFVEVKLRSANAFVPGYFAVNGKKKDILQKTCKAYLRQFGSSNICHRFDVVAIEANQTENFHRISHYENVKLF
ncbi:MAG: YraN family protein [Puniceicoccales bacterium]|jgi:putative endonuclease|nr:YraN family protein [Puniceicoccales bacterium]